MLLLRSFLAGLISACFFDVSSTAPIEAAIAKTNTAMPGMAGPPVVFGSGTYPRANKLSNGNILGVYTAFNGGENIIETVLSTDNGQSW